MPRCLVTGVSGFVGRNLCCTLIRESWQVRGLIRRAEQGESLREAGGEAALGALADADSLDSALAGVDVVFHVAGRTAAFCEDEFRQDNVEGTRSVAAACARQSSPPKLVVVSSLAAGGPAPPDSPRTEILPATPISAYGRSKLDAEIAAREFAGQVNISVVRPPVIFGPGDRASLAMYRQMKFLPMHLSPGWSPLPISIVYVHDLCDALLRIALGGDRLAAHPADAEQAGAGVYYVAGARNIDYAEMGKLAATAAGWAIAVIPVPLPIFWTLGTVGETIGRLRRRPVVLNRDKVREAAACGWVCDDAKLRRQLAYRPAAPLETQFEETVAWYRRERWI
ncbi:MAG: NAD-dependent epimerase/dehydratase family protein [Planctomycetales bacterium]|nr:NAD-dependent epimerase/dehydratase family protein [Planctomycetales bacterium]